MSASSQAVVKEKLAQLQTGNICIPPSEKSTLIFPGFDGGAEWGGAAYDKHKKSLDNLVAPWIDTTNATNSFTTTAVTITLNNVNFKTPVWVDLMTLNIYEIPKNSCVRKGNIYTFTNIPVYDAPVLVAENELVMKSK